MRKGVESVAFALALVGTGQTARADSTEHVRVTRRTSAAPYVVEAAMCALHAMRVGGQALDFAYEGRSCRPAEAGALAVRVHLLDGQLELETDATSASVQTVLGIAADELEARIADADTSVATARALPREQGAFSPAVRDLGAGLVAVGLVACVASAVMATIGGSSSFFPSRDATFDMTTLGVLGGGAGLALLVGAPLWLVGGMRVARVSASASPVGASLRITF